ncbi:PDZ domain-containing protein [Clostridium sp.]|uniref:PDZ domain-containing protein n=1 Tax=Clostridium sp. TaxID=1506 RepID=UPI003463D3F4
MKEELNTFDNIEKNKKSKMNKRLICIISGALVCIVIRTGFSTGSSAMAFTLTDESKNSKKLSYVLNTIEYDIKKTDYNKDIDKIYDQDKISEDSIKNTLPLVETVSSSSAPEVDFSNGDKEEIKISNDSEKEKYYYNHCIEENNNTIGLEVTDIDSSMARKYRLEEGVYVSNFGSGSIAEKSGVKVGDVIVEFNGVPVKSANDINALKTRLGNKNIMNLGINREGQELTIPITL